MSARAFVEELGARAALVKGGHREEDADDLLAIAGRDGTQLLWLKAKRVDSGPVHGTGCALSAAITAGIARGESLRPAIDAARRFVSDALRKAHPVGSGARFLGYP
jgi:hydroxymethylpyrimidine/phosphomethylpyrimidine kinase